MSRMGVAMIAALSCLCAVALLQAVIPSRTNEGLAFMIAASPSNSGVAAGHSPPADVPPAFAGSQRLRHGAGGPTLAGSSAIVPVVGLFAVALVVGAVQRASSRVKCRAVEGGLPRHLPRVLNTGTIVQMTEEEQEAFLEERKTNLSALMPMSDNEFEDEVDELFWNWQGNLLQHSKITPKKTGTMHEKKAKALPKRTFVRRNEAAFRTLRLFKPIAMKYPHVIERTMDQKFTDPEDRTFQLNANSLAQTERIAGFTYEDWAKETNGLTYDNWLTFQEGDLVSGVVMSMDERGVFVEIGDKTWGFMPLEYCSLAPIAHPEEVLSIGDDITAEIVELKAESRLSGEMESFQKVLSLKRMQNEVAWDEVDATLRAEAGTSSIYEVMVKQLRPWGAIVQTERGLEGFIPNRFLADKVGDSSIVGTKLEVELVSADRNKSDSKAARPGDFALQFSYASAATKKLAESLEEGMVVDGVVKMIDATSLSVDVMGSRVTVRKIDISGTAKRYEIAELFELNEEIKLYIVSIAEKTGGIRLSIRALEFKKGALLTDKAAVFERAEQTAKKYFESSSKVKAGFEKVLEGIGGLAGGDDSPGPKKKGGEKAGSVDIEDGLDF